jgi:GT2 family glycosyltransferase
VKGGVKLIDSGYNEVLRGHANPLPQTSLFKRELAFKIGGFDCDFVHGCEDTDFFARLAKLGPILFLPHVLCYYRNGHFSLTKDRYAMNYSRCVLFGKNRYAIMSLLK